MSETGKKEVSKQTVAYSPRSKLGTLLPEFPNVKDLNLPASLPEEKVTMSEVVLGVGGFSLSLSFSLSFSLTHHSVHTHTHTHTLLLQNGEFKNIKIEIRFKCGL